MLRLSLKAKAKMATVLVATTSVLTLGNAALSKPASADPAAVTALNGVGSDTIQDVMDAFSGADPYPANTATNYYTQLHSDQPSGAKTVNSWDAVPFGGNAGSPGCITTTYGGASFDRPNGSGNGVKALSHAIDTTGNNSWWSGEPTVGGGPTNNPSTSCTGAPVSVAGQINFARSSAGPKNTSIGGLTYIPFGGDALSFAYFDHNTQTIATLTSAQLTALYSSATGTITVGSDTVHACISQQGSGTTKFWEKALNVTDAQAQAASAASGCTANPSLLEENGGNSFYAYASTLAAGQDAVVDFSAGSWISQANPNTAVDRSATARANHVDLGAIDSLGKPYSVNGSGLLVPSSTFYASPTYGRPVYNVVPTSKISGLRKDPALVSLFVGATTSQICAASVQPTLNKFGFETIANCGATTITGNLYDTPGGTQTS